VIFQEMNPWNFLFTVAPIIFYIFIFAIVILIRKRIPYINSRNAKIGFGLLAIGIFFFKLGLDETNDYLRCYHGLWHLFIGLSAVFTWQINCKLHDTISFEELLDIFNIEKCG